ncbi:FAD/NAD(P)-binding protein [Roseateles sp. DB2]|uniref:FAD/NAD(P)-binding protein n=1 Tax=Roseateles sp. DB2 TaxID=3453717 RepID=UPI003EEE2096
MHMQDCAIVGGGFTGTALALHLLERMPAGSRLTLINAGAPLGRGLAYGTQSPLHLLNVPAGRMAWRPDRPDDFITWLGERGRAASGKSFVPRAWYGEYLAARLQEALRCRPDIRWTHEVRRIRDCHPCEGGWALRDDAGGVLQTRRLVLALGHFTPQDPHPSLQALEAPRYIRDPWQPGATQDLAPDAPVAIVGAGLTMLDLLTSLDHAGHRGPVLCLSRRGIAPLAHRDNELPPPAFQAPQGWIDGHRLRACVRQMRDTARRLRPPEDWRDLWVALRARTPALWQGLDLAQRRQFLRHLQVYWDVHRHRAAPTVVALLERLLREGRLTLHAGRLAGAEILADGRVSLHWTARGHAALQAVQVQRVFNCTGPSSRIERDPSGLFQALASQGRLQPCPLGLGVHTAPDYQLLDAEGHPQQGLYYLGPLLRAQHWEATAVPELRVHAQQLADVLQQGILSTV